MTRRELLKRTTNYIEEYTVIVGFQGIGALTCAAYYKEHAEHFSWYVPILISIMSLMMINTIFGYYYVYDILKKNICEATIISLTGCLTGVKLSDERVILARVIEGTIVGKSRNGFSIKRKKDRDYIFKAKLDILRQATYKDKMKIKYLKHSRAIVEAEIVTKIDDPIFFHITKGEEFRTDKFLSKDIAELIREGEITHIYITLKERIEKFFYGLLYGITSTTIIFAIQVVICFGLIRLP